MKQDSVDFYKYKHSTSYNIPVQLFLLDKDLLIYTSLTSVHALYPILFSVANQRDQDHPSAGLCYHGYLSGTVCLPGLRLPTLLFSQCPEPLGSAHPFGYKSNTSYVPLTRKGPKYKALMYYFPSWQTYSLPFLTMNIFWGAIMCQASYWTSGIWTRKGQFAHQECLANYDTMSVICC